MKKLILLAIILIGCSKDEDINQCSCDLNIIIVDPTIGITGRYTIDNVPSDCNDNVDWQTIRQDLPSNHWLENVSNCK
jgi:hypothetical protein